MVTGLDEAGKAGEMKEENSSLIAHHSSLRLAVLIGGGGRLRAVVEGTRQADSRAEVALVVSFKRHSAGLEWAREIGLPTEYFRWADWKAQGRGREEFDLALAELLHRHRVDLVVLAGWGLLISSAFLAQFPDRVINIHPALLTDTLEDEIALSNGTMIPVFRGNHAIEEAWEAGVPFTGCTVHYVTTEMDAGPVILKREVPRLPDDSLETLSGRVHAAEDELLPQAIQLACRSILATDKHR